MNAQVSGVSADYTNSSRDTLPQEQVPVPPKDHNVTGESTKPEELIRVPPRVDKRDGPVSMVPPTVS